jgi:endonuclease III
MDNETNNMESAAQRCERLNNALDTLQKMYPEARSALYYDNAFELLIATILSAQCTDRQVNAVTETLFAKYPTPKDFLAAGEGEIAKAVKSCGFYQVKARHIVDTCRMLEEEFGGSVPSTMEELTKLPGVGRKTANVVLSNAFGKSAIAVDTHVFRVANRIGLAKACDVLKTEMQLMENIPQEKWSDAHHWLIWHGRRVCSARNPTCMECRIREFCEYGKASKAD